VEEHDDLSESDSATSSLPASEWYVEDLDTYEVKVAVSYSIEYKREVCISADYEYLSGSVGIEDCSTWL